MGFEVNYSYRESISPGEYDEEIKTKLVKIGKPYEDTSMEILAGKIMAQLARRNILIVDVEIFEFAKKKISYKESDDGILIKNKKYKFDDGPSLESEDIVSSDDPSQVLASLLAANPNLLNALGNQNQSGQSVQPVGVTTQSTRVDSGPKRAIRWEVFFPELKLEHEAAQAGYKLTKDKKYPIFREETKGMSPMTRTVYHISDDQGNDLEIGAEFFVPKQKGGLSYEDEMTGGTAPPDINLWGGMSVEQDNIDIRR